MNKEGAQRARKVTDNTRPQFYFAGSPAVVSFYPSSRKLSVELSMTVASIQAPSKASIISRGEARPGHATVVSMVQKALPSTMSSR